MRSRLLILIVLFLLLAGFLFFRQQNQFTLPQGETTPLTGAQEDTQDDGFVSETPTDPTTNATLDQTLSLSMSNRTLFSTDGVKHSIPLDEIRQGCFGRDCIPSVDDPSFISTREANDLLPTDTVGIGLVHKGEKRFYPFNMLVTREIVNDVVAGDPLAITYCPLCRTGVVFSRRVDNKTFEFGVSGMLWQSNLMMYNREKNENDISLWSQVLGEAVLGTHTGTKLPVVPSDIVRYTDWRTEHPSGLVLNTGRIGDPYGGDYYGVARGFRPNFDESASPLSPTAHVFGIERDGQFKAYDNEALPTGTTVDTFGGETITIEKSGIGEVRFFVGPEKNPLPTIAGFWFSWVAAHPQTELFK